MPRLQVEITVDPWYPETHVLVKVYSRGKVYALRRVGCIDSASPKHYHGEAIYRWKHYRNDFIPYNEATGCFIRA